MENNEIKNLWKNMVDKEVRQYSEAELNVMVVKSARKSMRQLYPGWKVKLALCIFVVCFMLWKIVNTSDLRFVILYTCIVLIITASLIVLFFSMRKMNKYKPDIPVKEWLKFRINEIDKSIRFNKKYRIYVYVGIVIEIVGICAVYFYILTGSLISYPLALAVAVSLLLFVVMLILWKNRHSEVRDYLQSLYEQIDG